MRREGTRALFAALAALFTATAAAQSDVAPNRSKVEAFAAELAAELSILCAPAAPGDQAAFDRCRQGLFDDSFLKRGFTPVALWGRVNRDPQKTIKDSTLTQFGPD